MSSSKANKKTQVKLSCTEMELARQCVAWFVDGSGETSIEHIAALHGLDADELYAWAIAKRYMFRDSEYAQLEMMPAIWSDFAPKSRTCFAFYTALRELAAVDERARKWEKDSLDLLRRWAAKREGRNRAA